MTSIVFDDADEIKNIFMTKKRVFLCLKKSDGEMGKRTHHLVAKTTKQSDFDRDQKTCGGSSKKLFFL
jgi:hypothetical protein